MAGSVASLGALCVAMATTMLHFCSAFPGLPSAFIAVTYGIL